MNKKVKGIVAVAVTAVILAGTLFACSRKSDTPKSTDSSLTTSITKEEQSSKTNKTDKSSKDKSGESDKTSKTDKSDKTDKSNKDEVKDNSTTSEDKSDKSDKSDKINKRPEKKKPEQTKSQKETKRNNVTQGTTKRQAQSTTRKQTQNTTQRQTQGTTKRQTQNTTKSTTRSTTKSTTARPRPADKVEYKTETKDYSISYRTVDNYSSTGAESRVYQQGKNGTGRKTYKVKYVNGVRQNAELISDTVVTQAQDHIIERYVQTEAARIDRKPKIYRVERPVYKDFWFANCRVPETNEPRTEWFESAKEASDYHYNLRKTECQPTNWGGPQQKQVGTEIKEIEDWEEIEIPAKFEWKH